jgi:hypothetical protein
MEGLQQVDEKLIINTFCLKICILTSIGSHNSSHDESFTFNFPGHHNKLSYLFLITEKIPFFEDRYNCEKDNLFIT